MTARRVVWLAVALAVLGRYNGLLWPLRPDEAGFLLVARAWDPQPDAVFHPYFVDRPPSLIALVRLVDAVGGPYFLRVVGALGCGVAALLAAGVVRELARSLPLRVALPPLRLVTAGTALMTAAFLVTPQIDAVATKGELLGVPVILASCLLSLRALRTRSAWWAFAAGVLAMAAVGLKQSLVGGLVFGGVLLVTGLLTHRVHRWQFVGLAAAALAGAAVPVALTIGWAWSAGVELESLRYAVLGFRADASMVIVEQENAANLWRTLRLALIFTTTGMGIVLAWCLLRVGVAVRRLPAPTVAAVVMVTVDATVIVLSGSFWSPYLFALVPSLAVLWACIRVADLPASSHGDPLTLRAKGKWHPRREVLLVALCVVSSVVSLGGWTWLVWWNGSPPRQYELGQEIARVSAPGDTLTVYGGRADIQWSSGLDSPYEHLWSLPMRTMDPELEELHDLLAGPDAPTWLVGSTSLRAWDGTGVRVLRDVVNERYEYVGRYCDRFVVRRLADAPPVEDIHLECERPWGRR